MNREQMTARDFTNLALLHARDGAEVTRAIVDKMKPATRDALARLAGDLAAVLTPAATDRKAVATGIPQSPTVLVDGDPVDVEPPKAGPSGAAAAHDALPSLGRISRG